MNEVDSWTIYGLRENTHGSKYRYVGYTTLTPRDRLRLHKYDSKKKVAPVNTWVNSLDGDVIMEVIESCPVGDKEFLFEREIYWIAYYRGLQGSLDDKRTPDYLKNFEHGGGSGSLGTTLSSDHKSAIKSGVIEHFSKNGHKSVYDFWIDKYGEEEANRLWEIKRLKASANTSGENNPMYGRSGQDAPCYGRVGELHPMFGTHHSEEAKAKISAATKGKPKSELTKIRMSYANHIRFHSSKVKDTCKWCHGAVLQDEIQKREQELNGTNVG
jgi:hypothetical protein